MTRRTNPHVMRAAIAEYERMHWGRRGEWDVRDLVAGDPTRPLVALGELVSVTYRTEKGSDRGPTDYEHAFSERRLPILAFEPRTQLLVIAGGIYRVHARGIVD